MPYDKYRALPLRRFTALQALELNGDAAALDEDRGQAFDARPLADLRGLTSLSLQQFEAVEHLGRLPAGGRGDLWAEVAGQGAARADRRVIRWRRSGLRESSV